MSTTTTTDQEEDILMSCPFCGYEARREYAMLMHMDQAHPEDGSSLSPLVTASDAQHNPVATGLREDYRHYYPPGHADDDEEYYADCPIDGCGEPVPLAALDEHVELHAGEDPAGEAAAAVASASASAASLASSSVASPAVASGAGAASVASSPALNAAAARQQGRVYVSPYAQPAPPPPQNGGWDGSGNGSGNATGTGSRNESGEADGKDDEGQFKPGHRRHASAVEKWKQILHMPVAGRKRARSLQHGGAAESSSGNGSGRGPLEMAKRRLGKSELGRYANENKMPQWLVALLQREGQVVGKGVVTVLAQLLEQSPTTQYAYLCHPCVWHVSKLRREGGFCGYRNIQMQASYIISPGVGHPGAAHYSGALPSIFQIQDFIEAAWDKGINAQGRAETGGIRGTRKYIGTPEAQALYLSLGIPCSARAYRDAAAQQKVLDYVERYYASGHTSSSDDYDPRRNNNNNNNKVRPTPLPPVYLQHRGHSLTVVGLERRRDGSRELLVFDPMFHDGPGVARMAVEGGGGGVGGVGGGGKAADGLLKPYRRGYRYLRRFREFEVLVLQPPPPPIHAVQNGAGGRGGA